MSCWGSNATWLRQVACFSGRKVVKTCSHVALAGRDVVLGLQRDVAVVRNLVFVQKSGQKRAPRRIGGERCRVGSPTRRGWGASAPFAT